MLQRHNPVHLILLFEKMNCNKTVRYNVTKKNLAVFLKEEFTGVYTVVDSKHKRGIQVLKECILVRLQKLLWCCSHLKRQLLRCIGAQTPQGSTNLGALLRSTCTNRAFMSPRKQWEFGQLHT